jgi:hypothetical protein
MPSYNSTARRPFKTGGRVGLKSGGNPWGKKGILEKAGEAISRKWRGKEKTEHEGLEQDKKTGAYTHNAPKDRMDTAPGRFHKFMSTRTGPPRGIPPRPKSNDMSYKERKKEIAKNKKEAKRKDDFDKKHKVGKYKKKTKKS